MSKTPEVRIYRHKTVEEMVWGRIKLGLPDECWEWQGVRYTSGYPYGNFTSHRLKLSTPAHRMVWILIHGQPPEGMQVCHSCDNPPCCNPKHLWLGTRSENAQDCVRKGRKNSARGENCPWSRLTEEQVREIRSSKESGVSLARRMGVYKNTIYHIRSGKNWKWLGSNEREAKLERVK